MKKLFASYILLFIWLNLFSQEWEHLTPVKSNDKLKSHFVLNDSVAYIGGFFGSLIKSSDKGDSWSQVDDVTAYPITGGIWGMHFPNDTIGYIPDDAGRIFKTVDGSASWTQIYLNAGSNFYDAHFFNPDTGFVCGEFGELLKTMDGGDSWETIETGETTRLYDFCFTSDSVGYIALRDGDILRSNDSGNTWLSADLANTNDLYQVEFFNDSIGMAVGLSGTILRTSDAGANWGEVESNTTNRLISVLFISEQIVLIVGDYGLVLRSDDGGETFDELDALSAYNLWGIMKYSDGLVYAYGDRNVFESFDQGNSWNYRFDGVPQAQLMRILFTDSITAHSVGRTAFGGNSRNAIIKSSDGAKVWHSSYESLGSAGDVTDISFIDEDNGFASAFNTIRKTSDGGESNWNSLNEEGYFTAIHFFNADTGLVGNTQDGIFRSTDGGNNWNQVDVCGDVNHFFFLDRDTGYAAVDGGSIRKTIDGGATWEGLNVGVTYNLQSVFFVNDSTGFTVGDWINGMKTTDYGNTWSSLPVNQYGRDIYCPDPNNPDSIYFLVASGEVQKSIDGGATWTIAIPSMNNQELWDFEFMGPYIYACGDHGDILKARIVPCIADENYIDTVVCESYLAPDGSIYYESGNYQAVFQNQYQCDSIININLEVHQSSNISIVEIGCENYTAPDGQVYTESGNFEALLISAQGCDSLISIDLTIINIDLTIEDFSPLLMAVEENGSYQWIDCDDNFSVIEGEDQQWFDAEEYDFGSFAVILNVEECIDTTNCVLLTPNTINEILPQKVFIYPNPSQQKVTIQLDRTYSSIELNVKDISGRTISEFNFNNRDHLEINIFEEGYYFIELRIDKQIEIVKVLIRK